MLRSVQRYSRMLSIAGALSMTGVVVQQGGLGQLGLTEAAARSLVLREVANGNELGSSGAYTELVAAGRKAYQKLPAATRGPVTTTLFAWAKSYASSPDFKAAYGKLRGEAQPQLKRYELTVDQEVQQNIEQQLAGIAEIRKAAASMPAAQRAQVLESAKQGEALIRSAAMVQADRGTREEARATEKASFETTTREWRARYPADVREYVAVILRQFLAATAGVDFSAKLVPVQGEGGDILGFADPAYQTKPWQWVECILVGPQAVSAARTAAEAWLKELGTP